MCTTHNPEPETFNVAQAQIWMRSAVIGAGVAMILLGTIGIGIALLTGGRLGNTEAAYKAGLTAIILAGIMVIAVGGLRSHITILRHQASTEAHLDERLDTIDKRQDHLDEHCRHLEEQTAKLETATERLASLLENLGGGQERLTAVVADYLEDELRPRRERNGG